MRTKTKKLTALLLCVVMLIGSVVTVYADTAAAESTKSSIDSNDTLQSLTESMNLISYDLYKQKYGYVEEEDRDENNWDYTEYEASVDGVDYDKENTTAEVEVKTHLDRECVIAQDEGNLSWSFDIEKAGWYTIAFDYAPVLEDTTTDIERLLRINGIIPYDEARYISFAKTWEFDYVNGGEDREGAFQKDDLGNERSPKNKLLLEWNTFTMKDNYGYYTKNLEFYFKEGKNIVTLEGIREPIAISKVSVHTLDILPTYAEVLEGYESNGYEAADADAIFMEAELPVATNSVMLYPVYDRSSSITSPQDSALIIRNTIGAEKWTTAGKWIRYEFKCEASGLYEIVTRHRQDEVNGMYVSRSVKINGEFPFEEAKNLRFDFNSDWQAGALTDGYDVFKFYFEEGETYTLEFEVTLGNMAEIIRRINNIISNLNDDYMSIIKLTGSDPDVNRDYGLSRIMPDVIADLGRQSNALYETVDYISEMNGIKSDNTSTLEQAAVLIERMASDEDEIAANLSSLKDWVSSLGTWVGNAASQFLELDYLQIQPAGSEMPQAVDGVWQAIVFEIKKFFVSFYADYNSIGEGDNSKEHIEVWTSNGRDQAQIIKDLVNDGFAPDHNASVNLKLTAGGTLLQAILAGVGPDVSIDGTSPMEMAIRGAIIPLNDFDTFDEVMTRFADSAVDPLTLYGNTYAVPVNQITYLMYVRNDIISQLGLKIPETWDELMSMVPVLQFNNMEIGMATDYSIFLYQQGGHYWKDEGMETNLGSSLALDSFEYMCNLFTQYSLPINFEANNRFKSGEMPLFIGSLDTYNTLQVFAPEIAGLWSFYQIPGTLDEETGVVNHDCISFISGVIMPTGCRNEELAWDFLDWYSDAEYQINYGKEMVALLGPSGKQSVANLEAFAQMPWSETEYKIIEKAYSETYALEAYPGDYIIARYTAFALNSATNEGADPSDELLSYISTINKEITRKRREFDMMVSDEWQAVKAYLGIEEVSEWREYWASEGHDDEEYGNNTCIRNYDDAEYTYVNWMNERGVSVDSYEAWSKAVDHDETELSYKEWTEQK